MILDQEIPQELAPNVVPRNPFFAFGLSILSPGLGQIYNGQPKKGVLLFSMMLLFLFIAGIFRLATYFYGLVAIALIELSLFIYIITDAIIYAKRQKEYVPKSYNKWYFHLLFFLAIFGIRSVFNAPRLLGIANFHIPSQGNEPTIHFGDLVVADNRVYQYQSPKYGDIITYNTPNGIYCFRVAGLPNDRLEIHDHILTINGQASQSQVIGNTVVVRNDVMGNDLMTELEEIFPNGNKHRIYRFSGIDSLSSDLRTQYDRQRRIEFDKSAANMTNIIVPPDCYYVLGDSRSMSNDSRYTGPIKKEDIVGQVIYSYWGSDFSRINVDFR